MIRNLHPHTRPQRTYDRGAVSAEASEFGYEPADWPARKIVSVGAPALVLSLAASLGAMALVVAWLSPDWPTSSAARRPGVPPPRLETNPRADREQVEMRQAERLARAPLRVRAAMDKVAREGWRDGSKQP